MGKTEKEYELCCDFGYDITSPLPSVEPVHKNSHCIVPAVVGTTVELFPGEPERYEFAEFVSFLTDENRQNVGIKCRIKPDPKILQFFGAMEDLVWEVDLICGKEVWAEDNSYTNGKNTHTYRRLILKAKDPTIIREEKEDTQDHEIRQQETDMDLSKYDEKCVRITTAWGEVFEGVVAYDDREYAFHEYGRDQEALRLTPIILYKDDILNVISLEDVNGPFGHYSEKYGLLEKKCLQWGTDMIEEVFDSEDDSQILRMLACMKDNYQALADRAVPGIAPWRSGTSASEPENDEDEQGPIYLGELERMLNGLVKYNENEEVVNEAKGLLEKLSAYSCRKEEDRR